MEMNDDILMEYENADMNRRLHMFLDNRDFRRAFSEMEPQILLCESERGKAKERFRKIKRAYRDFMNRMLLFRRRYCPIR